jgi:nondiscriminating glutamyl-tRNA synthetase
VNFLALLGWSPGTEEEVFTTDELIARFSIEAINRKGAIFDVQKLMWLNGRHLNRMPADKLLPDVLAGLAAGGSAVSGGRAPADWLIAVIELVRPRARTLADLVKLVEPWVIEVVQYDPDAVGKHWSDAAAVALRLARLRERIAHVEPWSAPSLETALRALAGELGVTAGALIHPLRVALTGTAVGPGVFDVTALLGRERVLARLGAALATLERQPHGPPAGV